MRGRFSSTIFSTYYYLMSICQKSMVFIALPLPATLAPTYQNQMQRLSCNFFSNHQWWHKNCCFEQKLPATRFQGWVAEEIPLPRNGSMLCTRYFYQCMCALNRYTIYNVPAHVTVKKNWFQKVETFFNWLDLPAQSPQVVFLNHKKQLKCNRISGYILYSFIHVKFLCSKIKLAL